MPRPTSQDLAGYWDMLQLSVEDVSMKFDELQQLKLNDWKILESPERKVVMPLKAVSCTCPKSCLVTCSSAFSQQCRVEYECVCVCK